MTAKKRTDIYNVVAISERMPGVVNAKQKITSLLLGTAIYSSKEDIKALIKVLEAENKETIGKLKKLLN